MRNCSILVVDDDSIFRSYVISLLSKMGFVDIREASSASEAISSVNARPYNLILLDIEMGGISGLDALALLKKKKADVKIIIVSSFSSADNVEKALRGGVDGFLVKPFKYSKLKASLLKQGIMIPSGDY